MAVDWAVTYVVGFLLLLADAGVCSEPSTAAHLRAAQRGFLALCAALATPWLVTGIRSRHHLRVTLFAAAGLAGASPDGTAEGGAAVGRWSGGGAVVEN